MSRFIKLHLVYQSNPAKKASSENDLLMRETYFHKCDILEITPIIAEDDALMAKTYIRLSFAPSPISVIETANEIIQAIDTGGCE